MDNFKQLQSAEGWYAVILCDDAPYFVAAPLMAVGLVESPDGTTRPVGLYGVDRIMPVDEVEGFHTYVPAEVITPAAEARWSAMGREWHRERLAARMNAAGMSLVQLPPVRQGSAAGAALFHK
jgi:hypothetical protein